MPTSTVQPWTPTVKPLTGGIKDLESLYKSGGLRRTYGPNRVAGLNPTLGGAWDQTEQRARTGGTLTPLSKDYYSQVLRGDFLGRDAPGFSDVLAKTQDMVNANASAGSRYGSGAHSAALGRELGGLQYQNYLNERGYMDQAAGMAPEMDAADYFDLEQLRDVGGARQAFDQLQQGEKADRFAFNQTADEDELMRYLQQLGLLGGMGSVNYAPQGQQPNVNPWLTAAGAGTDLLGSAMGSNSFWDMF
jgi:hypothetical protein